MYTILSKRPGLSKAVSIALQINKFMHQNHINSFWNSINEPLHTHSIVY